MAIDAVNPGNSKDTRLNCHFNLISDVEAFEVVWINWDPFDFLAGSPGLHDQAAGSSNQTLHQKLTFDALRNINWLAG